MNVQHLYDKYVTSPQARDIVATHSRLVADKAVNLAKFLGDPFLDLAFIEEAALLHDIGVFRTHAPDFGCTGNDPYIRHGIIGREILEAEGLFPHALVCERHIGVGLTVEDIIAQKLPLPLRDMAPITREERIVGFADLYYSKHPGKVTEEKTTAAVRQGLARFGGKKVAIFDMWLAEFGIKMTSNAYLTL